MSLITGLYAALVLVPPRPCSMCGFEAPTFHCLSTHFNVIVFTRPETLADADDECDTR